MNNYAFIDSQNVNLGVRAQGWELDFGLFRQHLADAYGVMKAYLFIGYMPTNQKLYQNLEQAGFTLMYKPTLQMADNTVKGNVDAELVLYAVSQMPNYDRAVLVSGDGDFYSLADYLLQHNKLEIILVPNKNRYSQLYTNFINRVEFMNDLREKLARERYQGPSVERPPHQE